MIYKNIFTSNVSQPPTRLRYEAQEFNFSEHMLENMLELEDLYFTINQEHMMVTHLAMKDESLEILEEGFKDFSSSVVDFFKKMIDSFKEFMNKVFMYFSAYMGNFEKFLNRYKNNLVKLNPDFTIEGYEYSFKSNVPNLDKISTIISTYNSELSNVPKLKKQDIIRWRDEFLSADMLDNVRGHVLGWGGTVTSSEFTDIAKQTFRNKSESSIMINVDNTMLQKVIHGYEELKKVKRDCEQQKNKTILLMEQMKKFFQNSASVHYKDDKKVIYAHRIEINERGSGIVTNGREDMEYNGSVMDTVNAFYNYKWNESKELGQMAVTAMSEKVNALKEALKLYETIVRRSLGSKAEGTEKK